MRLLVWELVCRDLNFVFSIYYLSEWFEGYYWFFGILVSLLGKLGLIRVYIFGILLGLNEKIKEKFSVDLS